MCGLFYLLNNMAESSLHPILINLLTAHVSSKKKKKKDFKWIVENVSILNCILGNSLIDIICGVQPSTPTTLIPSWTSILETSYKLVKTF